MKTEIENQIKEIFGRDYKIIVKDKKTYLAKRIDTLLGYEITDEIVFSKNNNYFRLIDIETGAKTLWIKVK
jgi:hypothetical protein